MSYKRCSRCLEDKLLSSFSKDRYQQSGYKSACKQCAKLDFSKWREKNKETVRIKDMETHYIRKYNLSEEDAKRLVKDRVGVCKICGGVLPLVVDHCHTSNKIRGFICQFCNSVLGYSKDNIKTLENAIKYLEDFYG